jgi:GNAT superfamily N-acetyltransferase
MNHQLIRDEGHRNEMTPSQLTDRMVGWLRREYKAVLFENEQRAVGYVLFLLEPDYVYIRHLFVVAEFRRQGIARNAIQWLKQNVWTDATRLRIDVLVKNTAAHEFWSSVGFHDYALTMEAQLPVAEPQP